MKYLFFSFIVLFLISCGGLSPEYSLDIPTDSPPTLIRVEPVTGPVGTEVTIFGFGFSFTIENNVINIDDQATTASTYNLLNNPLRGEMESLTFTVPNDIETGEYPIVIIVNDNISNSDITFTVTGS